MAQLRGEPKVSAVVVVELSEEEARALNVLVGYSPSEILSRLSSLTRDIESHRDGFTNLFTSLRGSLGSVLSRLDDARAVATGQKDAKHKERFAVADKA